MSIFDIILLAIALGIDCLVLSFSQGLIFTQKRGKNSLSLALTMGLFQGFMPVIGYACADLISDYVSTFADWLVFGIFFILGVKFIIEAFEEKEATVCCIGLKCLISMGIATSIDALVAGASLHFSGTHFLVPSIFIGIASFVMSLCGFWFGNFFKKITSKILEISGGLILILLAIKAVL